MPQAAAESHELLGIGLNERGKYNSKPEAKLRYFLPRLHEGELELSTFALDGLEEEGVWALLDQHVGGNGKRALARAEITPVHVREAELQVDPNWEPERHVNIVGWPPEEPEQRSRAQVLYSKQKCIVR